MQHLRSAGCERVRFVVAEIVQQTSLRGLVGIFGVDTVDVGPDDEFVGIDDVRDDRAGKVGAVATKCGKMWLGILKGVASQDKFGRGDRNRGNAGAFESGGEQARAEAFAERG